MVNVSSHDETCLIPGADGPWKTPTPSPMMVKKRKIDAQQATAASGGELKACGGHYSADGDSSGVDDRLSLYNDVQGSIRGVRHQPGCNGRLCVL